MTDAQPPAYSAPPAGAKTNTLSIIALVLGIVVPIGGIICGPIALGQIKRTGEGGRGLAIAGIVIGSILTLLTVIYIIVIVLVAVSAAGNPSLYN